MTNTEEPSADELTAHVARKTRASVFQHAAVIRMLVEEMAAVKKALESFDKRITFLERAKRAQ